MVQGIRGTAENIPVNSSLWVVIYPHAAHRYYPQNDPVLVEANDTWYSDATFGTENNTGGTFDIVVALIDPSTVQVFREYIANEMNAKTSLGLEQLPRGAKVYKRITVTRK
jgi:hypothetical protein